ncbi:hypothetical protein MLD38_034888 [Melastoma candidum]|uniref:Uncharacterized protein n=1 Tax=Melastoma candidum TaxID=119954 RepID=A0ACB9MBX5_9MYRT|nr:hypothetical protein MLD38_034888 [Melastoma candidum]
MADEVIPPLQNGDPSGDGAPIKPDVETVSEKDVSLTENPMKEAVGSGQEASHIATAETSKIVGSPKKSTQEGEARGLVDTAAPFESVKEAVSKFGGIVDWKAHKLQTVKRQKIVEQGLEKVREEIPRNKKKSEIAEEEKVRVLKELEGTKRLIEELKLNLERAQKEEHQAKQDSELASLRVEEMEQGIDDESSVAAKSQLEVARARHAAAVAELKLVKDEMDKLRKEYDALAKERDLAVKKSEEAVMALKEVEKTVEELTLEMIAAKESLESAQAAHVEAEEHRIGIAMAKEQDSLTWEKELKRAEEELSELESQVKTAKDLKSNLNSALALLTELKGELTTYMESKHKPEESSAAEGKVEESEKSACDNLQVATESARKELEDVKLDIEKATAKVDYLKVAAASLQSELEKEISSLTATKQREGIASVTVSSLEANLRSIQSEIELAQAKEKEAKDRLTELPKQLQQAAEEADDSKSLAQLAREQLQKAEEEAEQVRAAASTVESRLLAARKEIEAAKASENLALAAIKALQESGSMESMGEAVSSSYVTLSIEEYYDLSKHAHEAEEQANIRVADAFSQIEIAKQSEQRNLSKLEQLTKEISKRKEALEDAKEKAEEAKEGKLGAEDELRKWRAEHERRRKASESSQTRGHPDWSQAKSYEESRAPETNVRTSFSAPSNYSTLRNPYVHESYSENESSTDVKVMKKKKGKLLFPRIFTFLAKRRASRSFKSR